MGLRIDHPGRLAIAVVLGLVVGGLLGFVVGGVVTVVVLRVKRGTKPSEVAHGPSMFAAAIGVVLFLA